jgi:hypothetical protein
MKRFFSGVAGMVLAGFAASVQAAAPTDTVQDYTHALPLNVSGKQGVVRFQLPQPVYLYARSPSLDDLRVFDARGMPLAFALQERSRQMRTESKSLPVKLFPIFDQATRNAAADSIALDIHTGADGSLLSIQTLPREAGSTKPRLAGLVLDLRQGEQTPLVDSLQFILPAALKTYRAQLWVEASDDLKQWDPVGTFELSWMVNSATETLSNDTITFEPRRFRYARLSWRSGEPVEFAKVSAGETSTSEAPAQLEKLVLQPQPGHVPGDLVYTSAVAIPVQQIGLQFAESNVVMPAQLGSYRELPSRQLGKPSTWQFEPVFGATFYRITQGDTARSSGDVALPPVHLDQWVLRPQTPGAVAPQLRLGWSPATLIFLANGNAPYTLAFGRDDVASMRRDVAQVAPGFSQAELATLEVATAGPMQLHAAAPVADAGAASQRRLWILWGVLILGVAVLALFALRLMKQMR